MLTPKAQAAEAPGQHTAARPLLSKSWAAAERASVRKVFTSSAPIGEGCSCCETRCTAGSTEHKPLRSCCCNAEPALPRVRDREASPLKRPSVRASMQIFYDGWRGSFAVCAAQDSVGDEIHVFRRGHQHDLLAVHREFDPLRHTVLMPDHVLGQLVLDVPLNGAAQRPRAGVRLFLRLLEQ